MKLHIDTENKTVAIEGKMKIATVFNYLMSWFPEDWEEWSFIPFKPAIEYKEIIVQKDPYWNPWKPYYGTTGSPINSLSVTPTESPLTQATINFNQ